MYLATDALPGHAAQILALNGKRRSVNEFFKCQNINSGCVHAAGKCGLNLMFVSICGTSICLVKDSLSTTDQKKVIIRVQIKNKIIFFFSLFQLFAQIKNVK